MEKTILEVKSSNPDVMGIWHKADVEADMRELGLSPGRYDNWISYILNHFDFPSTVVEVLEDDDVHELKFTFEGDVVHVLKR